MTKVKKQCAIKHCSSLVGAYRVDEVNPTRFYSTHTGVELLIKRNDDRKHFLHAPYQLFVKPSGEGEFYYFSGMFPISPADIGHDRQNEFRISDIEKPTDAIRKPVAIVTVDMFNLTIKPC
jgi:hypothetical protein